MIPYLAQGANSSIEDGAVIGLLLSKMSLRSHLPRAIQMYEKMRKARGEAIARESLLQVSRSHSFMQEGFLTPNSVMSIRCMTGQSKKSEMQLFVRLWDVR